MRCTNSGAREIDHAVDELGRDDLALQPVGIDLGLEFLGGERREIRNQQAVQIGIVGQLAFEDRVEESSLA